MRTADCVRVEDMDEVRAGRVSDGLREHAGSCPTCRSILEIIGEVVVRPYYVCNYCGAKGDENGVVHEDDCVPGDLAVLIPRRSPAGREAPNA